MLLLAAETDEDEKKVSDYLLTKPRTLREVCQSTGRDNGGRGCVTCCVRDFCEKQAARVAAGSWGAG